MRNPQMLTKSPAEIGAFLRALVASDATGMAAWLASHPADPAWSTWLIRRGLAPLAYLQLRRAGLAERPTPPAHMALRQAYYRAVADAELHGRELTTVLDTLATEGVVPALFKGAVLAHTVYPTPACRPMGDLDLWVTADEMPRAQAALEAIGYTQRIKATRPLALQAQLSGEVQMIGRGPGRGLVELHWGVFAGEWLRRTGAIDNAGLRDRLRPVSILGRPALALAPEDAIIQVAVHLAINHQMAHPGMRGLLDVALLARSQPVDWRLVAARATQWRVATATWLVLQLTDELLGLDDARPALAALTPGALRRRAVARFADGTALLAGRNITRTPLRFIYQLLLVDRPTGAARLLLQALWPEDDWLAARYGRFDLGVRLAHLAGALRGRV